MKNREQIIEELLVLRCQDGDGPAFGELVDRWQERLWRHARLLTGDDDAAWDVVQETWVAIVKGISRLQDAGAFPKWAHKIVNAKSVDWIRKRQSQRKLSDNLALESASDQIGNEQDHLRAALARLPVEQRSLLSLHYAEGYGMSEIAEIIGIPEGTVKSRLYNAREQLRKLMENS